MNPAANIFTGEFRTTAIATAIFIVLAIVPARGTPATGIDTAAPSDAPTLYQRPEKWTYSFAWWPFLRVGSAEITAMEREGPMDDNPALRSTREIAISIAGKTNRLLDAIWRYRITADAVVPLEPLRPGVLDIHESIKLKPKHTKITYEDGEFYTWRNKGGAIKETRIDAPHALGIFSTFYTLFDEELNVGDRHEFETIVGRSRYDVQFEVLGNDRIKIEGKKHAAIKLNVTGADLTDPEDTSKHRKTTIWVSAEKPRRLLQAVTRIWIGTVKIRLRTIEPLDLPEQVAVVDD
ncbi:MAG: DUF3108 domain-containing protein [Gammaproteobacteria bacterium]|nr:DUF3108 domain-containing protein [Gammaproteobacteria bacterium]NND36135.1 DUF3108 domain-containing protein [Gammaproteobacteria bacterium]